MSLGKTTALNILVLGFTDREVHAYLNKEMWILTGIIL